MRGSDSCFLFGTRRDYTFIYFGVKCVIVAAIPPPEGSSMALGDNAADEVSVLEIIWRLSQVNPNVPRPQTGLSLDIDPHAFDVLQLEHCIEEWHNIAESYRELAQLAIEAAARHYNLSNTLTKRLAEVVAQLRRQA